MRPTSVSATAAPPPAACRAASATERGHSWNCKKLPWVSSIKLESYLFRYPRYGEVDQRATRHLPPRRPSNKHITSAAGHFHPSAPDTGATVECARAHSALHRPNAANIPTQSLSYISGL
ncbi:unnamed protein product, partial [Brenthis ino]